MGKGVWITQFANHKMLCKHKAWVHRESDSEPDLSLNQLFGFLAIVCSGIFLGLRFVSELKLPAKLRTILNNGHPPNPGETWDPCMLTTSLLVRVSPQALAWIFRKGLRKILLLWRNLTPNQCRRFGKTCAQRPATGVLSSHGSGTFQGHRPTASPGAPLTI